MTLITRKNIQKQETIDTYDGEVVVTANYNIFNDCGQFSAKLMFITWGSFRLDRENLINVISVDRIEMMEQTVVESITLDDFN